MCFLLRNRLHTSPAHRPQLFSMLGLHSMRRSGWLSWRQNDQQSLFLVPGEFHHSEFLIWSFCCPASFHWVEWFRAKSSLSCDVLNSEQTLFIRPGEVSRTENRIRDELAVFGQFYWNSFIHCLSRPWHIKKNEKNKSEKDFWCISVQFRVIFPPKRPQHWRVCPRYGRENLEECTLILFYTITNVRTSNTQPWPAYCKPQWTNDLSKAPIPTSS